MLTMFDTQAARSSSLANVPKSIGSVNIQQSHDNQAEFKRLEEEHKLLTAAYAAAGGILTANVFIPEPVTRLGSLLAGTVTAGLVLKRIEKINAILRNARALDETFQQQEVQLFLDLPVPENGRLDLFVRFPLPPKKAIFTIALRSQGNSTIFYNEQKESLYVRARGLRRWTPDHIERLSLQEYWLRKNRLEELFGTSSRDKNRGAVKLLVLTGETRLGQHSESLYTTIGQQTVLLLRRRSSLYVLEESDLLALLKAWLAH